VHDIIAVIVIGFYHGACVQVSASSLLCMVEILLKRDAHSVAWSVLVLCEDCVFSAESYMPSLHHSGTSTIQLGRDQACIYSNQF
jgi:hypothetical protein